MNKKLGVKEYPVYECDECGLKYVDQDWAEKM